MRLKLQWLVLFLVPILAHATASVVQEKSASSFATGTSAASPAFSSAVAIGDTVLAWVQYDGTVDPTGCADGASQSYVKKLSVYISTDDHTVSLYVLQNNASHTALVITCTWAATGNHKAVSSADIGGVTTAAYQTGNTQYQPAPGATVGAGTAFNPTSSPALVVAFCVETFPTNGCVADTASGYTAGASNLATWGASENKRVTSTASVAGTFTTADTTAAFGTIVASFTESGGSSVRPSQFFLSGLLPLTPNLSLYAPPGKGR